MYSLVHKTLAPRKDILRIKVVNIFTPNVFITTLLSSRVAPTELYLQLEHLIARVWQHEPGWHVTGSPTPGTFVIAMLKNKSNFKRGVVLKVSSISGSLFYYVFLYDWGIIERFKITELAKLSGEYQHKLKPRTFIVVHAGMVEVLPAHERHRVGRFSANTGGEMKENLKKSHRQAACTAARNWFEAGQVFMDTFKTFDGVILMADIKRKRKVRNGDSCSVTNNEYYSLFMEEQGYYRIDSRLSRADKDLQNNNWESVAKRMEKIRYEKVVKLNGNGTVAAVDDPSIALKDMHIFDATR